MSGDGVTREDLSVDAEKARVRQYYDERAGSYRGTYECDLSAHYPSNVIRLNLIKSILARQKARTVLEAGCGTGDVVAELLKAGFEVRGFDFSRGMVRETQLHLERQGLDPQVVTWGDVEDPTTYPSGRFDAILCLGVLPHVRDEVKVLENLRDRLAASGRVVVGLRNGLFATFTFNQYSYDFFMELIRAERLPPEIRVRAERFFRERMVLGVAEGEIRTSGGTLQYTDIRARLHNPLTVDHLFETAGLRVRGLYFYHFHALPPQFEQTNAAFFRERSLEIEDAMDWRGHLMASAFLVEAEPH